MGLFTKEEPNKFSLSKKMSYKLDVYMEPHWGRFYKKVFDNVSEDLVFAEIDKKKETSANIDSNLYGRRYYFTEYYDSSTGLTMRFQRVIYPSGKVLVFPVDEFGDTGYFFESDGQINRDENSEERIKRGKLLVKVGENFVCNNVFDENGIGEKMIFEKEDYLFQFPLNDIFNFRFALGKKYHDTENNAILKWPDQIQNKFDDLGIKYETYFEYEPDSLDIDENDKEFYERWGRPVVALSTNSDDTSLRMDGTAFGVKLKIFKPIDNERFEINNE